MKVQVLSYVYELDNQPSIGPIYYFLRSFCDSSYPDNQIDWCEPIYKWESAEECVKLIIKNEPDLLLVPMFVWTEQKMIDLCKKLKLKNNRIKIIGGGPNIDGKNIKVNFETYPFFDEVIYGDGEEAFYDLYERYKNTNEITAGLNCATQTNSGFYRRFKYENYKPYKIYTHKTVINQLKNDIKKIAKPGKKVMLPYETDRGCPYKCSFCDWSSGLHHKLSIRDTEIIKEEVDFISSMRDSVRVQIVNANYGLIKHDHELLTYMISKDLSVRITNWSKIKKDIVFSLMKKHIVHEHSNKHHDYSTRKFAIQSIFKDTRDAINRPDVSWIEHKKLIKDIIDNHDPQVTVEIISDLPLMTTKRHLEQLIELSELRVPKINYYPFILLPNSPANDEDWIKKWGYKTRKVYSVHGTVQSFENEQEVLNNTYYENYLFVTSVREKIFNELLYEYYNSVRGDISNLHNYLDIFYKLSLTITKQIEMNYKKSGKYVWGIYMNNNWQSINTAINFMKSQFSSHNMKSTEVDFEEKEELINLLKSQHSPRTPAC